MNLFSRLKPFASFFDWLEEASEKESNVMNFSDATQVALVSFKDKGLAKSFRSLFDVNDQSEIPNLKVDFTASAMFPLDYLKKMINTFDDEYVLIQLKEDAPLKIVGKTHSWFLAPRIQELDKKELLK